MLAPWIVEIIASSRVKFPGVMGKNTTPFFSRLPRHPPPPPPSPPPFLFQITPATQAIAVPLLLRQICYHALSRNYRSRFISIYYPFVLSILLAHHIQINPRLVFALPVRSCVKHCKTDTDFIYNRRVPTRSRVEDRRRTRMEN